jgi:hypothetical protein
MKRKIPIETEPLELGSDLAELYSAEQTIRNHAVLFW